MRRLGPARRQRADAGDGRRRRADEDGPRQGAAPRRRAAEQLSPRGHAGPARAGCNTGACHGYSLGKNGFKLSLRGAGPGARLPRHHQGLVRPPRQLRSRRRPACSGQAARRRAPRGRRPLPPQQPLERDPRQAGFGRARPATWTTRPASSACGWCPTSWCCGPARSIALQLIAEYSDGTHARRDAPRHLHRQQRPATPTSMTRAWSSPAMPARRPSSAASSAPSPPPASSSCKPNAKFAPTPVPQDNLIDRHVVEKLNRLKITPSPLAGDEEFLRRVYLDLIGVQPKPDEIRAFLADKDAEQARQGHRRPVRAAGVRRSLVAQVGRPAAELAQQRQLAVGLPVPRVHPRRRGRRTCRWTSSPARS